MAKNQIIWIGLILPKVSNTHFKKPKINLYSSSFKKSQKLTHSKPYFSSSSSFFSPFSLPFENEKKEKNQNSKSAPLRLTYRTIDRRGHRRG